MLVKLNCSAAINDPQTSVDHIPKSLFLIYVTSPSAVCCSFSISPLPYSRTRLTSCPYLEHCRQPWEEERKASATYSLALEAFPWKRTAHASGTIWWMMAIHSCALGFEEVNNRQKYKEQINKRSKQQIERNTLRSQQAVDRIGVA